MKKNTYLIGWISLIIILSIAIANKIILDSEYSIKENRHLKTKPTFTISTFLDGSFQKNQETYLQDQFINRSAWMELKTKFEKTLGIKKINDIYFGKNNRLIQEATIPNNEFLERRINNINKLIKTYQKINFDFILIPDKIGIYPEEVNSIYNQEQLYQEFTYKFDASIFKINSFDILKKHKQEKIYYDTDHHWTTLGAKYISEEFYSYQNREYNIYTANNHFSGTLANRIAYYQVYDTIELYHPKDQVKYYIRYPDLNIETTTLYNEEKQYGPNPYEIFLGGNHSQINIKTTSEKEKKLLLLKDSYANCFIPFMLNEYQEIIVIDPRYYFDELDKLIEDKQITDILFLYNMNTFFKDIALDELLENIYQK